MREEQFYGGSAQEVEDSCRTYKFFDQQGELLVRHERGKVILSVLYLEEAHKAYANALGRTVPPLSQQEKREAVIQAMLECE